MGGEATHRQGNCFVRRECQKARAPFAKGIVKKRLESHATYRFSVDLIFGFDIVPVVAVRLWFRLASLIYFRRRVHRLLFNPSILDTGSRKQERCLVPRWFQQRFRFSLNIC